MRRNIVAGNWKMNKSLAEAMNLTTEIQQLLQHQNPNAEVILCPPALYLVSMHQQMGTESRVKLGGQNAAAYSPGAYTGEIAADMLASAGIPYVILGHSERRTLFGETDQIIKTKIDLALGQGLQPIFCCGEPLETRENNQQNQLVKTQVETALFHLDENQIQKVIIAYEPVWAIGTGKTASADQAQEMHAFIRSLLAGRYGGELADEISILYGGSVKSSNAGEIFAKPDVDGGLIGGASLQADEFVKIVLCA